MLPFDQVAPLFVAVVEVVVLVGVLVEAGVVTACVAVVAKSTHKKAATSADMT
jgi:hypothetical protein